MSPNGAPAEAWPRWLDGPDMEILAGNVLGFARSDDAREEVVRSVLSGLERSGQDIPVLRLVANSPSMIRPFLRFAKGLLFDGSLPREIAEVVALRIAFVEKLDYEWAEHAEMAQRYGLSVEQIAAIAKPNVDTAHLPDGAADALAMLEHLLCGRPVPVPAARAVSQRWGDAAVVELILLVGWFAGLVRVLLQGTGLESLVPAGRRIPNVAPVSERPQR